MSTLVELQRDIMETSESIALLESELAKNPSTYLVANMESILKRHEVLEARFREEASKLELDVCAYRLFSDNERPLAADIGSILSSFQNLFSVVLGAIMYGPRTTTRVPLDVAQASSLGFGYTFSGSIGIMMTLPNQKSFLDTQVDEAMKIVFEMMGADDSRTVSLYAREYGVAAVRAMYSWAESHTKSSFGADIRWKQEHETKAKILVQSEEIERLRDVISATSETTTEILNLTGMLVGVDSERKSFHFKVGEENYFGKFESLLEGAPTIELPKRYNATISMRKKMHYSTEKEEIEYLLEGLKEVS